MTILSWISPGLHSGSSVCAGWGAGWAVSLTRVLQCREKLVCPTEGLLSHFWCCCVPSGHRLQAGPARLNRAAEGEEVVVGLHSELRTQRDVSTSSITLASFIFANTVHMLNSWLFPRDEITGHVPLFSLFMKAPVSHHALVTFTTLLTESREQRPHRGVKLLAQ